MHVHGAVAHAVLRAAEHDDAQLPVLAGGQHVLVHQPRRVKAQPHGVGGLAEGVPPRGAPAVVDDQYVVVHRLLRQARHGQGGDQQQRQQRDSQFL